MKYVFIKDHRYEFSVALMCELLRVSRSGFYAWITRKPSNREQANIMLDSKIKFIFEKNKQRYGSPRITRELKKQNELCSDTRVANRMKVMNIKAIAKKKFKVTTDSQHFPKRVPFDSMTNNDLQRVARKLNNRPRKCLGYKTPFEVFSRSCEKVGVALGF